jgi:hypothetical protein
MRAKPSNGRRIEDRARCWQADTESWRSGGSRMAVALRLSTADAGNRGSARGDRHGATAVIHVYLISDGRGYADRDGNQNEREQIGLPAVALVAHRRTGVRGKLGVIGGRRKIRVGDRRPGSRPVALSRNASFPLLSPLLPRLSALTRMVCGPVRYVVSARRSAIRAVALSRAPVGAPIVASQLVPSRAFAQRRSRNPRGRIR